MKVIINKCQDVKAFLLSLMFIACGKYGFNSTSIVKPHINIHIYIIYISKYIYGTGRKLRNNTMGVVRYKQKKYDRRP